MQPFIRAGMLIVLVTCMAPMRAQEKLDAYLRMGLESNESLHQQEINLEKSLLALQDAKGLYLPTATFMGSYTLAGGGRTIDFPIGDLLNPVYSTLNQLTQSDAFPQLDNQSILLNPNNFYDVKVRTTMPLINAEIGYNRRIRAQMIPMQEARLQVLKRELVRDIKTAYFRFLQAGEAVEIYREARELVSENIRVNERLAANGMANPTLVIKARAEYSKVEAQLFESENQLRNATAYVNFLLNRPLDSPLDTDPAFLSLPQSPATLSDSPAGREELAQLDNAREVQALSLDLAKAYHLPKLSVFADLGSQGFDFAVNKNTPYYLAGVSLEVPIFSGMRNETKVKQAALDVDQLSSQYDQAENQLRLQITTAYNDFQSSQKLYTSSLDNTAASERYMQDTQKRYRENQVTYIELLEAQTSFTQARIQQSIARFSVWIRQAELERAQAAFPLSE